MFINYINDDCCLPINVSIISREYQTLLITDETDVTDETLMAEVYQQ